MTIMLNGVLTLCLIIAAAMLGAGLVLALAPAPAPAPRVCCRARLPAKGDTVRFAVICADLVADSVGVAKVVE